VTFVATETYYATKLVSTRASRPENAGLRQGRRQILEIQQETPGRIHVILEREVIGF
jgi:hypothetical protein